MGLLNPVAYYLILFKAYTILAGTGGSTPEYDMAHCAGDHFHSPARSKDQLEKHCCHASEFFRSGR